ncbi:NUDIX hydrolase [uncultured Roseibium sp.]|uniref:NUDIX hydrolase n=1 Tax=uncultured Roseibium sp. TaxID=1936171 RepID=UPI002631E20F|nr:NUDIX hydrolase [uncultured Roseibium sp.]
MEVLLLCAGSGQKFWEGESANRPLRTKGKRQAQKAGAWMGRCGLVPKTVYAAPCERAWVSAQKALKAGGWTSENIEVSRHLGNGVLPRLKSRGLSMLVAKASVMRQLISDLQLDMEPGLAPGVLLHLCLTEGMWRMLSRIDPRDLPEVFPFPGPDGPEHRERPFYYYTQSAVVPYRRTRDGVQVLIVGSSGGRHWVVPKGIVEPGLDPGASAVIEAREEAGVEGKISDEPIGSYRYEKWGALCHVDVYALEVEALIPEADWKENHRQRRWVTPQEAANRVAQSPVSALIRAFADEHSADL